MQLVECPDCKKRVSQEAVMCPNCGRLELTFPEWLVIVAKIMLAAAIISSLFAAAWFAFSKAVIAI